jgi:hypothetical protein
MVPGATFHNLSLGQGQGLASLDTIANARQHGHWVLLNNAHLVPGWLVKLDATLQAYQEPGVPESHRAFRLFVSSERSSEVRVCCVCSERHAVLSVVVRKLLCSGWVRLVLQPVAIH